MDSDERNRGSRRRRAAIGVLIAAVLALGLAGGAIAAYLANRPELTAQDIATTSSPAATPGARTFASPPATERPRTSASPTTSAAVGAPGLVSQAVSAARGVAGVTAAMTLTVSATIGNWVLVTATDPGTGQSAFIVTESVNGSARVVLGPDSEPRADAMRAAGVPVGIQAATGVSVANILPFGGPGYVAGKEAKPDAKGGLGYGIDVTCDPTILSISKCQMLVRSWINESGFGPDDYSINYRSGSLPMPTYHQ